MLCWGGCSVCVVRVRMYTWYCASVCCVCVGWREREWCVFVCVRPCWEFHERNQSAILAPILFSAGSATWSFLAALFKLPFCLNLARDS